MNKYNINELLKKIHEIQFKELLQNRKRNYLIVTQFINASIGIVAGKLIAQYVSPEQFGLYNLQFAAFTFFFSLLIGPTIIFIKASYQNLMPEYGSKPFFRILGVLMIILALVLVTFFKFYDQNKTISNYFYLILFLLIPLNTTSSLVSDQFNVLDKINLYSSSSVLKAIAGFGSLILFFFILPQYFEGYLILWGMQFLTGLLGFLYFIFKYKTYFSSKVISYKFLLKKHLHFTMPLMFLAIWSWVNNYFDRYAIESFMSLKDVGIYNASYGLGSKFFLLLSPIFMVILTPKVYGNGTINFKKEVIVKTAKYYFFLGAVILFCLYFLTDIIGSIFLAKAYEQGFYIIFWLALVYLILTATYLFETLFYAEHKTKVILNSNIIAALLNILLNMLLIPILGLMGAVIAMVLSTVFRFGFVCYKFFKL
jgi:O-antigen/teichoic acid export membrane protein